MKLNISIDDVSPHPLSSVRVLDRCYELIKDIPQIKFTLFIPFGYWRTVHSHEKPDTTSRKPFFLHEYPDFCDTIRNLARENFELGYHGLFHGKPGKSNNDEFKDLSYEEALKVMGMINEIKEMANLNGYFAPVFRPPAWKMSPGSFDACSKFGIKTFALSSDDYALETYKGGYKKYNHVFYNSSPPFKPLLLFPETEIVYHACEWDKNYLCKKKTQELSRFLKESLDQIEFSFLEEF